MAEQRKHLTPGLVAGLILVPLLVLFIAEIAGIIWVSGKIGWWTILLLGATSVLGGFLFVHEGRRSFQKFRDQLELGQQPTGFAGDAALIFAGTGLIMLPGFITDIIGLIFILPFTRPLVRRGFGWWLGKLTSPTDSTPTTIPGEVVEDEPADNDPENNDGPLVIEGTVIDDDEERR